MIGLLEDIVAMFTEYGVKVLGFVTSAASVILRYGSAGVTWLKNNIGTIVSVIAACQYASQFVTWITKALKSYFGW